MADDWRIVWHRLKRLLPLAILSCLCAACCVCRAQCPKPPPREAALLGVYNSDADFAYEANRALIRRRSGPDEADFTATLLGAFDRPSLELFPLRQFRLATYGLIVAGAPPLPNISWGHWFLDRTGSVFLAHDDGRMNYLMPDAGGGFTWSDDNGVLRRVCRGMPHPAAEEE